MDPGPIIERRSDCSAEPSVAVQPSEANCVVSSDNVGRSTPKKQLIPQSVVNLLAISLSGELPDGHGDNGVELVVKALRQRVRKEVVQV